MWNGCGIGTLQQWCCLSWRNTRSFSDVANFLLFALPSLDYVAFTIRIQIQTLTDFAKSLQRIVLAHGQAKL